MSPDIKALQKYASFPCYLVQSCNQGYCFRWVKYEEKMEEGGERWSKPHVASLSMHHLVETRRQLMDGVMHLDTEAYSISQVVGTSSRYSATQTLN